MLIDIGEEIEYTLFRLRYMVTSFPGLRAYDSPFLFDRLQHVKVAFINIIIKITIKQQCTIFGYSYTYMCVYCV